MGIPQEKGKFKAIVLLVLLNKGLKGNARLPHPLNRDRRKSPLNWIPPTAGTAIYKGSFSGIS